MMPIPTPAWLVAFHGCASERRAIGLGVFVEKVDRVPAQYGVKAHWFFRFGTIFEGRRHVLDVKWHTKPGCWQAAVRWKTRLMKGVL